MRVALPIPTSCDGCGVCCHGQEALPVGYWLSTLGDADPRKLPADLRANLEARALLFDQHGWPGEGQDCVWYDPTTHKCRHYAWRPDVCQEFERGGGECIGVRELHRRELLARIRQAKANARERGEPRMSRRWNRLRDGR